MKKGDGVKLTAAVLILVVAAVLIAWSTGVFKRRGTTDLRDADVQQPDEGQPGGGRMVAPGN